MKRRLIFSAVLLLSLTSIMQAAKILPNQPKNAFIVDNFEDKNVTNFPRWWGFDNISMAIRKNDAKEFKYLEKYSLHLEGQPQNWYVGGAGTYFAIDIKDYNALKLVIKGYGPKSGVLIVELFDDDNNNFEVEANPSISSETLADDKFIRTIKVDWAGWKVLILPLNEFVDGNIGIGDDKWNPSQNGSSGGLLQMQFVLLAADKSIMPQVSIDSIKFYHQGPMPMKKKSYDSGGAFF